MLYSIGRFLCAVLFRFFLGIEIKGKEVFSNIKPPFIFTSNHISNLDPCILGVISPYRLFYLAKEELFENRFFSYILKSVGAVPLKRGATDLTALRTALRILKHDPLVIFPQGSRRQTYDNLYEGIGFLYKKTGVPIIVARIRGSDKALPKGAKMAKFSKITVNISEVSGIEESDTYSQIMAKVVDRIKSL